MPTARGAERERLDDVGSAADPGVEDDRQRRRPRRRRRAGSRARPARRWPGGRRGSSSRCRRCRRRGARRASSGWQMPLSSIGSVVSERSQARSSQLRRGLPNEHRPEPGRRRHVLLGRHGELGAEHRVGEVVGQAQALELREAGDRQVARSPAEGQGVERDDDRRVAGRLGAVDEALASAHGRSADRAGTIPGCRRARRRRPPAGPRVSVDAIIGTPVAAAARAVTRSPWPSGSQSPITPTGASISGVGSARAEQLDREVALGRADQHPRHSPQRWNASTLARCVCSSPAPPATYDHSSSVITSSARRSSSANDIGSWG